jgi:Ca2+-binding EF-hand superfamily protein
VNKVYQKPIVDRRGFFDQQDNIRDQVNKIWAKHDINRNGVLDRVEAANFLRDFYATQGRPAPSMQQFSRFFQEFDKNRDGMIQKQEMARFIKNFMDNNEVQQLSPTRGDQWIKEQVD